jgi:DNA-directed RNA polymerase subunit H (RpoH/RPB5)
LHRNFIIEIPKAVFCPRHEIANAEDIAALKANYVEMDSCNRLALIFEDDPQCIWIGASAGDVVKITRLSNNTGRSIEYRKVVKRGGSVN